MYCLAGQGGCTAAVPCHAVPCCGPCMQIDVFGVHPGLVDTPLMDKADKERHWNAAFIVMQNMLVGMPAWRGSLAALYAATEPSLQVGGAAADGSRRCTGPGGCGCSCDCRHTRVRVILPACLPAEVVPWAVVQGVAQGGGTAAPRSLLLLRPGGD